MGPIRRLAEKQRAHNAKWAQRQDGVRQRHRDRMSDVAAERDERVQRARDETPQRKADVAAKNERTKRIGNKITAGLVGLAAAAWLVSWLAG